MSCGKHWTDCYCCLKKKNRKYVTFRGMQVHLSPLQPEMFNVKPLLSPDVSGEILLEHDPLLKLTLNEHWFTSIHQSFFYPRLPGSASFRWPKIVYSCTHEHDWGSEIFLFVRLVSFRCSAEGLELCSFRLFYHSLLIIKTCISAVNDVRDLSQRRHAVKNQYSYLEDVLNFLF